MRDYEETFSPVTRFETICLLLALVALEDWELHTLDIKTAFLFGNLDKEIYIVQPESFIKKGLEKKVCHLRGAIYSLKQAVLQQNKQLHKSLLELSFQHCLSDPGVYIKFISNHLIILVFYVDNALFMSSDKILVLKHKKQFMDQWESRYLGNVKEYLGMRITRHHSK